MAELSTSIPAIPAEGTRSQQTFASNACLWWIRPHSLIFFALLPLLLSLPLLPAPPKDVKTYFGTELYLVGIVLLVLFGTAAWVGGVNPHPRPIRAAAALRIHPWILDTLFLLSFAAYVIWFLEILLNPFLLLQAAQSGTSELRAQVSNIPGVTSFTQAAIPFFICYVIATLYCNQTLHIRFRFYVAILLAVTILRVFAWSERLALIEILVPVFVLAVSRWTTKSPSRRLALFLAPVYGIIALIVFFGAMEYFRSWTDFYAASDENFIDFILARVSNYYVTAVNNAIGYLSENSDWPRWDGLFILSGIYAMPGVRDVLIDSFGAKPDTWGAFLAGYLDEEFNNFSGLYHPVVEFGVIGASIFVIVCGLITGRSWRLFANGSIGGLLFYPLIYVALIDLLRIMYLGNSRSVIPIAFLGLSYVFGFRRNIHTRHGNA